MPMAAQAVAPLVLRTLRLSGILRARLRRLLEHFQHARALPRLRPSVALDGVLELRRLVAARRLVHTGIEPVKLARANPSCPARLE